MRRALYQYPQYPGRERVGGYQPLFGGNEAEINFFARSAQLEEDHYLYFEQVYDAVDLHFSARYESSGGRAQRGRRTISPAEHAAMLIACDETYGFEPVLTPAE